MNYTVKILIKVSHIIIILLFSATKVYVKSSLCLFLHISFVHVQVALGLEI